MVCYNGSNVASDAIDLAVTLGKQLDGSVSLVRSISTKRANDVVKTEGIEADLESAGQRVSVAGLSAAMRPKERISQQPV